MSDELEPPSHLDLLLRPGVTRLRDGDWDRELRVAAKALGPVVFDGLLLCDPYAGKDGLEPVTWPGPGPMPRTAEALALIADFGAGHTRTAALALRFERDTRVARWEHCGSLPIDVGTGGFVSAGLRERIEAGGEDGPIVEAWEALDDDARGGMVLDIDGPSAVISSTGWGDGWYGAWWGISGDGRPVCVALDWNVLTDGIFQEARLPLPLKLGTTRPPGIPDVRVKAGILGRLRPKIVTRNSEPGRRAYTRVIEADGAYHAPKILGQDGDSFRIDLRPCRPGATLVVRRVTGSKPMDVLGHDEGAIEEPSRG